MGGYVKTAYGNWRLKSISSERKTNRRGDYKLASMEEPPPNIARKAPTQRVEKRIVFSSLLRTIRVVEERVKGSKSSARTGKKEYESNFGLQAQLIGLEGVGKRQGTCRLGGGMNEEGIKEVGRTELDEGRRGGGGGIE